MKIENGVIKMVGIMWDTADVPMKAGSPVDNAGHVANNGNAIGLLLETVKEKPGYPSPTTWGSIGVLTGGDVDLEEVEKTSGITLTTEAKAAMGGIRFHLPDGTVDDSADQGYTLPAATATKLGGVKIGTGVNVSSDGTISVSIPVAANVAASEASDVAGCVTSINAILTALKAAGLMEADAEADS